MGRDIVLTYKRRRFSSRTDEPRVNLNSHSPSKVSEPNSSTKVTEQYKHEKKRPKLCTGEKSSGLEEKSPSANVKDTAGENAQSASEQIMTDSVKASRDIDLILPLDYNSEEKHTGTSKVHLSVDSSCKLKGKMPIFPKKNVGYGLSAAVVGGKGKGIAVSSPMLKSTAPKNNHLRSFPSNNQQSLAVVQSLPHHHTQPGQRINAHASYSSFYGRPNLSFYGRPNLQSHASSENMFSRAHPIHWSEEELDSLWIGVRRHGKGNWTTMLRDQKLKFMPWKSPHDLAHRWEQERWRLHQSNHMTDRQFQSPLPNVASVSSSYGRSRTQWRNQPVFEVTRTWQQPNLINCSFTSLLRHVELESAMKALRSASPPLLIGRANREQQHDNKRDELIVIPSGSSSEETISDDYTVRH